MSEHKVDLAATQPCEHHLTDFQKLFFSDFKAYNFFRPLLRRSDLRKDKCMPSVDGGQNKLSVDIFQL